MAEYPADWKAMSLGELCSKIGSGATPTGGSSSYCDIGVSLIRSQNVLDNRFSADGLAHINDEQARLLDGVAIDSHDVLLNITGDSVARVCIVDDAVLPARVNQHVCILRTIPNECDYRYLSYKLVHDKDRLLTIASAGATRNALTKKNIEQFELILPPLPEQKRIAGVLATADKLIANVEKRIAKQRAIKQGAMQELLAKMEGETSSLGDMEKKGYLKLYRGKVISKLDVAANPGTFPIYSSSVQNNGMMGRYGLHMFDEELISWSIDGGGNFFYRPRHKFSVTNVCGYMRVDTKKIDYRFLAYQLQHLHSFKYFDYQTKAHPSVIRKEYQVVIPSLTEQRRISKVLGNMDAAIENLERKLEKLKLMKQGMMQDLLTGKVRLKG